MPPYRSPGRIIAVEGPSGVGKSRLAAALSVELPGAVRLPEAFDRLDPPPSLEVPDLRSLLRVERALLAEDRRRWAEAVRARRAGRWVIADTGFVDPYTYVVGLARIDPARDARRAMARAYGGPRPFPPGWPDATLYLEAPPRIVAARVAADRGGHPPEWAARHAAVARHQRDLWTRELGPLLGDRFRRLRAGGRPAAIAEAALRWLRGPAFPPPLPPGEGRRCAASVRAVLRESETLKKGSRRGGNPRR